MRSCYSTAEKCFRILGKFRCKEQGSTVVIDGIGDGLIWSYIKKQMNSIDERSWHVIADFGNHPV